MNWPLCVPYVMTPLFCVFLFLSWSTVLNLTPFTMHEVYFLTLKSGPHAKEKISSDTSSWWVSCKLMICHMQHTHIRIYTKKMKETCGCELTCFRNQVWNPIRIFLSMLGTPSLSNSSLNILQIKVEVSICGTQRWKKRK